MKVLALEPYYGGSHKAFLTGWSRRSAHDWTILGLPAYKWKWRMRHAAITFAEDVKNRYAAGESWDVLFCSDMLNLAEFLGLAPEAVRALPCVAYFHENQLTYPVREERERDYHYAFSNLTTALAATQVWFNSAFHRDSFLDAMSAFLQRMPDHQPRGAVERIRSRASVYPQGVNAFPPRERCGQGPIHILWAARWEHDKNPELFFGAIRLLRAEGVPFRLSVIGERFAEVPPVFDRARTEFAQHIDRWGYQKTRAEYEAALLAADVIVSTADHEFFGISVVEAVAAGAYPLVPNRLAYPEVLGGEGAEAFFYSGDARMLADRLKALAVRMATGELWPGSADAGRKRVARYDWAALAPTLDAAIALVAQSGDEEA